MVLSKNNVEIDARPSSLFHVSARHFCPPAHLFTPTAPRKEELQDGYNRLAEGHNAFWDRGDSCVAPWSVILSSCRGSLPPTSSLLPGGWVVWPCLSFIPSFLQRLYPKPFVYFCFCFFILLCKVSSGSWKVLLNDCKLPLGCGGGMLRQLQG